MANFPNSKDDATSLPNPTGTSTQNNPDHGALHSSENAAIIAVEGKVGTGATTPTANTILFGTGTGTSAWTSLTSAQLAAILSDETGSGSNVFANTPTLITPKVDTINENTPGNGVTVGGVNLKSGVVGTGTVTTASLAANAVTTAKLATGSNFQPATVAQNPYKFSVYRSAAFTFSANVATLVPFDTKEFDTGTNIDVVTNKGRFTAPMAGFYFFNAVIGASVSSYVIPLMYKNGVQVKAGNELTSSAGSMAASVSALLQLSANDYVEIYILCSGTSLGTGAANTYFQGFLFSAT